MSITIPAGQGLCPCCNGTGRVPVPEDQQKYKHVMAGYDRATDTFPCQNCGGQYMFGRPLGFTKLDPETGLGCKHTYVGRSAGRCLTTYTCTKCNSSYDIDSSD